MTLQPADLLPAADYRQVRAAQRRAAIAHRRGRSLAFGPAMRLQFEDRHTVRHLVQELLHVEGADGEAAAREAIAQFAPLLPGAGQWAASLLIELPDAAERARRLPALNEAVHRLRLEWPGGAVTAQANEDLPDRHRGRPSGVHFLRFALPPAARALLRRGAPAWLGCEHPAYRWHRRLAPALLARLCGDESPPALAEAA